MVFKRELEDALAALHSTDASARIVNQRSVIDVDVTIPRLLLRPLPRIQLAIQNGPSGASGELVPKLAAMVGRFELESAHVIAKA